MIDVTVSVIEKNVLSKANVTCECFEVARSGDRMK
jgi:hypothetical protein